MAVVIATIVVGWILFFRWQENLGAPGLGFARVG
jgi:hypothetical protein